MNDLWSIIGSVTGIAALIISILSYRYAKKLDDQSFSLKRDELLNDVTIMLERLPIRIKEADRSKTYNLSAKGQVHSGVTIAWGESINGLRKRVADHTIELEEILQSNDDRVAKLKKLDRLKKVLIAHFEWLEESLKEDREEVLIRLQKLY